MGRETGLIDLLRSPESQSRQNSWPVKSAQSQVEVKPLRLLTDFGLEPKSVIASETTFELPKKTDMHGETHYDDGAGEKRSPFCYAKEDTVLDKACREMN